ncbi:MAG: substrate-binding domain-containing protein [Bacteroidia bacterium]|nr:substrate-binding domain-containing protein [Bacteroidia bacterium]
MKRIRLFLFLLLIAVGCKFFKGDPYRNTPTTGRSTICVDETFRPIIEAEIAVFKGIYGYTEVKADYVPENEAFRQLLNGDVQLIVASRPLTDIEKGVFNKKKIFPRQNKIATDAIALIVSPSSIDTLISINQIRDILTGKLERWEQINPASTAGKIKIVFDNEKSGIVKYMVDSICGGKLATSNVFALEYNRDVIEYTSTHPGVLGFIGASWISNPNDSLHLSFHQKIKVVSVSDNSRPDIDNSYKPYQAYMVDHIYPLTRDIYIINAEPRNGLVTGFSSFIASDKGQRIILKSGVLPAIAPTRVINVRKDF